MRCSEAEKSILLQDSGELGAARTGKLEAHLSGCAACRGFRQALLAAGSVFDAGKEPSARAVQDVLRTARITAPTQQHQPVFVWKPAMAVAATVTVEMNTKFRHPVLTGRQATVSAKVTRVSHPLYLLEARIIQEDQTKATATGKFYNQPNLLSVMESYHAQ